MALRIKSRAGESVDQMLRRFKKMCEKEGLIKDVKKNAYFEKPSERRRRAARKSVKRMQKLQMELKGLLPPPLKKDEKNGPKRGGRPGGSGFSSRSRS